MFICSANKKNQSVTKILVGLFMLIVPNSARSQLELYGKFNEKGSMTPIINYNGSKALNEKLSITFFGLVRKSWSQALIGVAYSVSDALTVSASAGIEHGKTAPRYSASIFMSKNENTLLVLGELGSGKENYLYKINAFHKVSEVMTFGMTAWRYHGIGPNFRYLIPKAHLTLWIMPAYDFEIGQPAVMIGTALKM
jgi:hypothetical protein